MRRLLMGIAVVLALTILAWLADGLPVRYGALGRVEESPDSSPSSRYRVTRVTITTTTGRGVTCLLREPTPAAPGGAPTLLLAGGQRTGGRSVLRVDSTVAGLMLACDYPWAGLAAKSGLALLAALPRLRAEILATPQVLGLGATYLLARPEADTARFAAVGASLGVPPVAAWAGGDPRPRAVALLYGGGELWRLLDASLEDDIGPASVRTAAARLLGALLGPIEPTRTVGGIAPRPLLVIGAADDQRIPRPAVEALFAAAREPKRLMWFGGRHMDANREALDALADSTLAWLSEVLR